MQCKSRVAELEMICHVELLSTKVKRPNKQTKERLAEAYGAITAG